MKFITYTPTLKDVKIWLALLFLIFIIPGVLIYLLDPLDPIVLITASFILAFFIFNFIVRRSLSFKNYFTSPYNFLTSKIKYKKTFDLEQELMFEKIKEVLKDSKFKLIEADKNKFEILAITGISFQSWGENLYISFQPTDNGTLMKVCTVSLFQIYTWGKNEKNYSDLIEQIDKSMTI